MFIIIYFSTLHQLKLYILYLTYLLKLLLLIPIFIIHKIYLFQYLKTKSKRRFLSTSTKERKFNCTTIHRNSDQEVVEDSNYRYNEEKKGSR